MKKKIIIVVGVILLIVIFTIANLYKNKGGEIPVIVDEVKRGDITQVVSGPGKVQSEMEVKISANVSAEIIGLYVEEGEQVHKGQLLIELDRTKYIAAAERAKSNKKAAEANLTKAKNDYERAKDLYEKKLTSTADLENAEASLQLAESQLEQALASLKQAEDDLAKTKLYSPIDGVVTKVNKEVGEIALGSMFQADVILIVADLSKMEVLTEIDENDVVLVSEGDTADIEIDAFPDTTFLGTVSEIALIATTRGRGTQEEVTNFEAKIAIIDQVEGLRPGMSATVDIRTETRKGILLVPIQAVTVRDWGDVYKSEEKSTGKEKQISNKNDKTTKKAQKSKKDEMVEVVFVVENGIAKVVPVETGISSDTDVEIKKGLQEGQQIVTGSYRVLSKTLKDGSKVKITKSAKETQEEK